MKQNKAREFLIKSYIESLEKDTIPWIRPWEKKIPLPKNGKTNHCYQGVNQLILGLVAARKDYFDPRWCTFNQAKEKGWHIKEGEKGTPIEYWAVYDKKNKKNISFSDYSKLMLEENFDEGRYIPVSRVFYVFNAEQIDGIPPLEIKETVSLKEYSTDFVDNVVESLGVKFKYAGNEAYYSPWKDEVVMPESKYFVDEYEFNSTALHELCHATGHQSRLNRSMKGGFGSMEYAKEELRAEISSSFLMADLDLDFDDFHVQNHVAYIQSWISVLKNEPNELFKAIKEAEKISSYVAEKGQLEHFKEVAQAIQENIDICFNEGYLEQKQVDYLKDNIKEIKHQLEAIDFKDLKDSDWYGLFCDVLEKNKCLER